MHPIEAFYLKNNVKVFMIKKLMMMFAGLFLGVGMAMAQNRVSGTVTNSEDGLPIIGASVTVVGTNIGTITDSEGRFVLTLGQSIGIFGHGG